jgi:hypothetical protein
VGGRADIEHPKVIGSHTRTCCVRNGVPTEGEGSYRWEGKASLKDDNAYGNGNENAHPNEGTRIETVFAPRYTDVNEDMKKKMHAIACGNLTWTPAMCYNACRAEMDANFPQGWVGLQKNQAVEPVRKSRHAQGLGNTIATVDSSLVEKV